MRHSGKPLRFFALLYAAIFILLPARAHTASIPTASLNGILRGLGEKDLLLQTDSGKVLRFRLLVKTEFRSKDGKPVRDSLMHPGDHITVNVSPDDPETAVSVIFITSGSGAERQAALVQVEGLAPESSDFGTTSLPENNASATRATTVPDKVQPAPASPAPRVAATSDANIMGDGTRTGRICA